MRQGHATVPASNDDCARAVGKEQSTRVGPNDDKDHIPTYKPTVTCGYTRNTRKRCQHTRQKHEKGKKSLTICLLNIQGNNKLKWEELQNQMAKQHIDLYALTETHLREQEEPNLAEEFKWYGQNRTKGEKRGGGIGFICHTPSLQLDHTPNKCKEHTWVKIHLINRCLHVCVVYMATSQEDPKWNDDIYECIKKDIEDTRHGQPVLLLGDFNCHITEIEGKDKNASGFRKLIERCNLHIANLDDVSQGTYTWSRNTQKTTVDYALYNNLAVQHNIKIKSLHVDEEKINNCGSDHNRIKISLEAYRPQQAQKKDIRMEATTTHWKTQDTDALNAFACQLETELDEYCTYEEFTEKCINVAEKTIGRRKKHPFHRATPWFDADVKKQIAERKRLSRKHRHMQSNDAAAKEAAWKDYLEQKEKVKRLVAEKIDTTHRKQEIYITQERKHHSKRFWSYIRSLGPQETTQKATSLKTATGIVLQHEDRIEAYMTKYFNNLQTQVQSEECPKADEPHATRDNPDESLLHEISAAELKRHINSLKNQKAAGLDEIPNEFIKAMQPKAREALLHYLNKTLETLQMPQKWKKARIKLLHKGKGKPIDELDSYRPIAVLSTVLKLLCTVLNRRIQQYCEKNNKLADAQNGFRPNRRTSDHLFTLTQAIEMKLKDKSQLFLAFLDMERAYDSVPHARLWDKLRKLNLEQRLIELIKEMYRDCTAIYELDKYKSQEVKLNIGLKQGCPLSPTLFNIYINELLNKLDKEGPGLRLSTITKDGQEEYTKIACLAFADDIVLLAESATDLQDLLDICSKIATKDQLKFNTTKTQWMGINVNDEEIRDPFTLQNEKLHRTSSYKYLGITIGSQTNYLEQHEKDTVKKSNRLKGLTWHLARHSYNPYTVGRTLWKALGVPAVTYADDVVAYSRPVVKCLEQHQNELGRWLLGGNCATPNSAITGEMGWSPYEIREARAKLHYAGRIRFMPTTNYCKRIYMHLRYRNTKTNWIKTLTSLEMKYNRNSTKHEATSELKWQQITNKELANASKLTWRTAVSKKQSLAEYYKHKQEPAPMPYYRGDRDSALLFQARTGSLLTQQRRHELFGADPSCRLCGAQNETLTHVLHECPNLSDENQTAKTLADSLAFTSNTVELKQQVSDTKRRLRRWEQLCRRVDNASSRPLSCIDQQVES